MKPHVLTFLTAGALLLASGAGRADVIIVSPIVYASQFACTALNVSSRTIEQMSCAACNPIDGTCGPPVNLPNVAPGQGCAEISSFDGIRPSYCKVTVIGGGFNDVRAHGQVRRDGESFETILSIPAEDTLPLFGAVAHPGPIR